MTHSTMRKNRRHGEYSAENGPDLSFVDTLCPSKLALAIHRQLLDISIEDPKFHQFVQCSRLRQQGNPLAVIYDSERFVLSIKDGRKYLRRLLAGHRGRHDID